MELTPRKKAVLAAIIKSYIETGEPVGSKILTGLIENAPSSATLRNEMSELCGLGLLSQPHTSAGRIPTSSGLNLYVNSLMGKNELPAEAKEYIDKRFEEISFNPEEIPLKAGKIISDLTGLPAVTCYMPQKAVTIKRIELMAISRHSAVILLILSDGRTRNRIFRFSPGFDNSKLHSFRKICDEKIKGIPVSGLNKPYIQTLLASAGINSLDILPLVSSVFEMAESIDERTVELSGETNLYNIYGDEENARRIISLVGHKEPFISIYKNIGKQAAVIFGNETGYTELKNATMVASGFGKDEYSGVISVIGPHRISYEQILPSIEYVASKLETAMNEALKDMED